MKELKTQEFPAHPQPNERQYAVRPALSDRCLHDFGPRGPGQGAHRDCGRLWYDAVQRFLARGQQP